MYSHIFCDSLSNHICRICLRSFFADGLYADEINSAPKPFIEVCSFCKINYEMIFFSKAPGHHNSPETPMRSIQHPSLLLRYVLFVKSIYEMIFFSKAPGHHNSPETPKINRAENSSIQIIKTIFNVALTTTSFIILILFVIEIIVKNKKNFIKYLRIISRINEITIFSLVSCFILLLILRIIISFLKKD